MILFQNNQELDIDFKNVFSIYFKSLVTVSPSILTTTLTSARYGYKSMRIIKNYCIAKKNSKILS